MKAWHFILRVIVGATIASAFFFTVGFHTIVQLFAIGLASSLGSHAVLIAVRRLSGDQKASFAILGGCVLLGAGATIFVLIDRTNPEVVRFRRVDELMEYPGGNVGPFFKLHGFVEAGSIQRTVKDGESVNQFALQEHGKRVPVELRGPVPDTFRDGAEVVATGHLRRAGGVSSDFVFVADELMAKCPSTYNTPDGPKPASQYR
jgi:cytochrome c-type biogenesis protein CcmE